MFNVCVLFVVRTLVSDIGRGTVRMCKTRVPSLRKITRMEDLLKTWVSFQKSFEDSRLEKKKEKLASESENKPQEHKGLRLTKKKGLVTTFKKISRKLWKNIQTKTVGFFARLELRSQVFGFSQVV